MSGKILSNNQIDELIKAGVIKLSPNYNSSKFQIAQYPLYPKIVWQIDKNYNLIELFKFDDFNISFRLSPKSYYIIGVEENIILPKGIVGRFIAPSNLIEKGLILSYGKIEYPYGQHNEKIKFGVYNCLDFDISIKRETRIGYIEFFDLRGEGFIDYNLNDLDIEVYNSRIYHDGDGPNYELDEDTEELFE